MSLHCKITRLLAIFSLVSTLGCASQYARPERGTQARDYYEKGLSLYSKRQYSDAIDQYLQALEIDPNWAEARFALGMTYNKTRFYRGAVREFEQVVRLKPAYEDAWYNLGSTLADYLEAPADGMAAFERALAPGHKFPKVSLALGELYETAGRLDDALRMYRQTVAFDPRAAQAWEHIGLWHFHQEEWESAEEAFRKVLSVNPGAAVARFNLGGIYFNRGAYEEAILEYRKLLSVDSTHVEAMVNLAHAYYVMNDLAKAEESFKKAAVLDSGRVSVYVSLAIVYEEQNRPAEAMAAYEHALVMMPSNTTALLNLGILYRTAGRLQDAFRTLTEYLRYATPSTQTENIRIALEELEVRLNASGRNRN